MTRLLRSSPLTDYGRRPYRYRPYRYRTEGSEAARRIACDSNSSVPGGLLKHRWRVPLVQRLHPAVVAQHSRCLWQREYRFRRYGCADR